MKKRTLVLALISLVVAIAAPFLIHPLYAMQILCFALFAAAFNLVAGYLGLISFGHAAFFGMAAYLGGHAVKVWNWPTEVGILFATLAMAGLGLIFGLLSIRSKGVYFAMITMALSQLVYFIAHQAPFTGGEDGMAGIPRGELFGIISLTDNLTMYVFVLITVSIGLAIIWRAVYSPFGQLLMAIRDNEQRVISLGYDVHKIKLTAFVLSAALSGMAGATKAIVMQFASQTDIFWNMSGVPVLASLIGGIGTLPGPVIGAAVMVTLEHALASLGQWVFFIQGLVFVLVVLFFRRGIWGEILALLDRRRPRPVPEAGPPLPAPLQDEAER